MSRYKKLILSVSACLAILLVTVLMGHDANARLGANNVTECYVQNGHFNDTRSCYGWGAVQDAMVNLFRQQTISAGGQAAVNTPGNTEVFLTCRDHAGHAQSPRRDQNIGVVWFTAVGAGQFQDYLTISVSQGSTHVPALLRTNVNRCNHWWPEAHQNPRLYYGLDRLWRPGFANIHNGSRLWAFRGHLPAPSAGGRTFSNQVGTLGPFSIPLSATERNTPGIHVIRICTEGIFYPGGLGSAVRCFPLRIRVEAPQWSLTPTVGIRNITSANFGGSNITAPPGAIIEWRHRVEASGNGAPGNVVWGHRGHGANARAWTDSFAARQGINRTSPRLTIPSDAAHGAQFCRTTRIDSDIRSPGGSGGTRESGELCVTVNRPNTWTTAGQISVSTHSGTHGTAVADTNTNRTHITGLNVGDVVYWHPRIIEYVGTNNRRTNQIGWDMGWVAGHAGGANPNVTTRVRSGFHPGPNANTAVNLPGRRNNIAIVDGPTYDTHRWRYTIQIEDAGRTICMNLRWNPSAANNNSLTGQVTRGNACVRVNPRWEIERETQMRISPNSDDVSNFRAPNPGWTSVGRIDNIRPGETVSWQHRATLRNHNIRFPNNITWRAQPVAGTPGPIDRTSHAFNRTTNGTTNYPFSANIDGTGTFPAPLQPRANACPSGWTGGGTPNNAFCRNANTIFRVIRQSDVSQSNNPQFCQSLWVSNWRQGDGVGTSGNHCVRVPFHYPPTGPPNQPPPPPPPPGTPIQGGARPTTDRRDDINLQLGHPARFSYHIAAHGPTRTLPTNFWAYIFTVPAGVNPERPDVRAWTRDAGGCTTASETSNNPQGSIRQGATGVNPRQCARVPLELTPNSTNPIVIGNDSPAPFHQLGGHRHHIASSSVSTYHWNLNVGDRICSYLIINPWSVNDNVITPTDAVSNIVCYQIARAPQMQLRGADSFSGARYFGSEPINSPGGFRATLPGSTNRGSWSQYGLLSGGQIHRFGSAGWTAHGNNTSRTCRLWFANTTGDGNQACNHIGQGGNFWNPPLSNTRRITLPSVNDPTVMPSQNSLNLSVFATAMNGVHQIEPPGGTLTIYGNMPVNRHVTLHVIGNVTINQNIVFGNGNQVYNSLDQIPILNIFATGNIAVNNNVGRIDGNFIAGGSIFTCGLNPPIAHLRDGDDGECNRQLIVNGALVTRDSPRFHRTYGAGMGAYERVPSEIINYTQNTFLTPWYIGAAGGGGNMSWRTTSQTVLPVRF